MWFYFQLSMWVLHWGLFLKLPWRTWVDPVRVRCGDGAAAWILGSGSTRYSGQLVAKAAGKLVL